jgi:ribA/ribD-fused uncharacterized protein
MNHPTHTEPSTAARLKSDLPDAPEPTWTHDQVQRMTAATIAACETALAAPVAPTAQIAGLALESMTRMFDAACVDLGLISESLGLDPDDGGAEPILEAITNLKLAAQPVTDAEVRGNVKPDTRWQVFFYEQDFYVLSNFSSFNLAWRGHVFPTSEHAYHWAKFAGDDKALAVNGSVAKQIHAAPSAHEAFKIAEAAKDHRRLDWDAIKVEIMRDILRAKANQHEYVRRKLLATGTRTLIEDSWRDDFWGWGANRDGQNMLGKLWMEVRAELASRGQA